MATPTPRLLLSFDFDGTLVDHGSDPPFHPALSDMLRDFRRRGVAWLVNTGRGLNQTLEGLAQHNIFLLPDYIIAQECEIFRPGFFKPWKDFGSWNRKARRAHDLFVVKHRKFLADIQEFVSGTKAEFLMGDLGQVGVVAEDDAELDQVCSYIEITAAQHPDVGYHRNGRYLRFSHSAFSKGSALRELSRLLRLPPQSVFAAGDNYNDLSMLDTRVAAQIACPSNALDPVKEHVSRQGGFVCTKPASEGMIEALEHFFAKAK
jgi:HAD superfamily hydrolase (TIGR01484 family)